MMFLYIVTGLVILDIGLAITIYVSHRLNSKWEQDQLDREKVERYESCYRDLAELRRRRPDLFEGLIPMDELPSMVISVLNSTIIDISIKGPVQVLHLNWDELTEATLGRLCYTYKRIWDLPETIREAPLCAMIREVRRRFPFTATFQAQHLVGDTLQNCGPKVVFDATEPILRMGPDAIDNLSDPFYPVEQLAAGLPEREAHMGQFEVVVDGQALAFIHAEENERNQQDGS